MHHRIPAACAGLFAVASLLHAAAAAAQTVNQPPQFCFMGTAATCPRAYTTDLVEAVPVHLVSTAGFSNIGFSAQDVDAAGNTMVAYLWIDGGMNHFDLVFNDPSSIVILQADGSYRIEDTVANIDAVLQTMQINCGGVSRAMARVRMELHDQGFTGACSDTQPAPCDKVATAAIYVDAYSGATPERIFRGGFESF